MNKMYMIAPDAAGDVEDILSASVADKITSIAINEQDGYTIADGVAVIDVVGVLTEWNLFASIMGNSTYREIRKNIKRANNDDAVSSIILAFDSPGGEVKSVERTAKTIANSGKPVMAHIYGSCCSAAYWLASQANSILCSSQTDTVGSIGVMAIIEKGKEYSIVRSSYTPEKNSEDPESVRKPIDAMTEVFFDAINAGRGWELDGYPAIAAKTKQGAIVLGDQAIDIGLVDGYITPYQEKEQEENEGMEEAKKILKLAGVPGEVIDVAFSGISAGEYAVQKLEHEAKEKEKQVLEEKAKVAEAQAVDKSEAQAVNDILGAAVEPTHIEPPTPQAQAQRIIEELTKKRGKK